MPKMPDRFERNVMKLERRYGSSISVIDTSQAVKLLRAEHAWMWGMVQKLKANVDARTKMGVGHNVACDYILAELDKRRK